MAHLNTFYIIAPDLTLRASPEANGFLEAIHRALQDFISVPILRTLSQLLMTVPDAGDAVVFFNREDTEYLEGLTQFLQKGGRAGAVILPRRESPLTGGSTCHIWSRHRETKKWNRPQT